MHWGAEPSPPFSYPYRQWRKQQLASYSSPISSSQWKSVYTSCEPTCFFLFLSVWVELSSFTSHPFHYPATSYFARQPDFDTILLSGYLASYSWLAIWLEILIEEHSYMIGTWSITPSVDGHADGQTDRKMWCDCSNRPPTRCGEG